MMPTPHVSSVSPRYAIAGGRVALFGSDLFANGALPHVRIGSAAARVVFATSSEIDVIVAAGESGVLPVSVGDEPTETVLRVGVPLATGLHQVDNPACDAAGNVFVTYSGTRGQQVPVSIFRIVRDGAKQSFSSAVTNPTSLAFGPDGALYVSSRFEGAVYRLGDDGSAEVFASDLGVACGLCFAPDGMLYVGDRSGTVFAVSTDGTARALATLPASVAAFHLAIGPDALYVTGPTLSTRDPVYRVSFDGSVSEFQTGFGRPQGMAFSPDGVLHVVEALAGVSGLYRVIPGFEPELLAVGPRLVGVAFAPQGDLILASSDTLYRLPHVRLSA
jgi:hypothetical protein